MKLCLSMILQKNGVIIIEKNQDTRFITNLKGLLIFLVVLGHVMGSSVEKNRELYYYIYSFHMPLFIFISGLLSKNINSKKLINYIFILIPFQFISTILFTKGYSGLVEFIQYFIFHPAYTYWYMYSIIILGFIILTIKKLVNLNNKKNTIILFIIMIIISLLARIIFYHLDSTISQQYSLFSPHFLSLQRVFVFLPFYFLGFITPIKKLKSLLNFKKAHYFILFIITSLLVIYFINNDLFNGKISIFEYYKGSKTIQNVSISLIMIELFYLILTFILGFLMIGLVSNKKSILTKFGENTLSIYLFHSFFLNALKFLILYNLYKYIPDIISELLSIVIAFILCLFLSFPFFNNTINRLRFFKN